jgi:PAS domain S-box-containing protein
MPFYARAWGRLCEWARRWVSLVARRRIHAVSAAEQEQTGLQRRYRSLLRATTDIIWTNDPSGKMSGEQADWAEFTGQTPAEYENYGWAAAIHPDDKKHTLETWEKAVAVRGLCEMSHRVRRHDGQYRYFNVRAVPVLQEDGSIAEWVGAHSDVHAEKVAEEITRVANDNLREANRLLRQEIDQRTRTEQALRESLVAKQVAEAGSLAKTVFLANMSHEIRTPLNAVVGMTELLGETTCTTEQANYISTCRHAGEHLLNLINDILDLSKIEAGHVELEKIAFDLPQVATQAMDLIGEKARSKRISLNLKVEPDMPQVLKGDPARLRQVLVNLLSNALKFTEHGGISLSIQADPEGDPGDLRFAIEDSGIGLAKDKLGLIFGSFNQADNSTTRKYGGTGLGLSISKKIVELMDGKIWVESRLGIGSTFFFTARFGATDEEVLVTSKDDHAVGVPRRLTTSPLCILLAEDNDGNRLLMQAYLKSTEWKLDMAENGADAFERFCAKPYDLVLMDMQMPVLDGYAATEKIRAWERRAGSRAVPILALTANAFREDVSKSLEAGCDEHLVKPIKKTVLLEAIGRHAAIGAAVPSRET